MASIGLMVSLGAAAQRECVVVDMETGVPLSGVVVTVDTALISQYRSNYRGEFTVPAEADSIVLGRQGYLSRHLLCSELTDTVALMRTFNAIREVVIYGSMPQVSAGISNMLGKLKEENKYMPRQTPVVSFDFFSILGLLGLIGMNIKNAIVLVEQIDLEAKTGKKPLDAVVSATTSRIVPVAMASGTTILGMLPLLFDAMFGGMAATIMGGLLVASALTLFVLPVAYCAIQRIKG